MDGRDLYRHRLAADAIFRATYRQELSRTLGVEWTAADSHGNRELAGMPEELARFSKRSHQIDAELDRLAAEGRERTPRLVKPTVRATRKPKQHEIPDSLYARWRQEAAERGVDADTLVRQATSRTANRDHDWTAPYAVADGLFDWLDKVTGEVLAKAWAAGAGPGDGPLVLSAAQLTAGAQMVGAVTPWTGRQPVTLTG